MRHTSRWWGRACYPLLITYTGTAQSSLPSSTAFRIFTTQSETVVTISAITSTFMLSPPRACRARTSLLRDDLDDRQSDIDSSENDSDRGLAHPITSSFFPSISIIPYLTNDSKYKRRSFVTVSTVNVTQIRHIAFLLCIIMSQSDRHPLESYDHARKKTSLRRSSAQRSMCF